MTAYYNEIDPYCVEWLRNLIAEGLIAPGHVDSRSIKDVSASDIAGYDQHHFFAGFGGWSHALRLAGWSDDRQVWTGSCPCQPFSQAGKRKGFADDRHLWPDFYRLIRECGPPIIFGEQVASAKLWIDGVCADMEGIRYAFGAAVLPACCVNAPHKRERIWYVGHAPRVAQREPHHESHAISVGGQAWELSGGAGYRHAAIAVGDASGTGLSLPESKVFRGTRWGQEGRAVAEPSGAGCMADTLAGERERRADITQRGSQGGDAAGRIGALDFWDDAEWLVCGDGKARRVKPGIPLLAHGVQARVPQLRAFGNAIVPQVAAKFIQAAA